MIYMIKNSKNTGLKPMKKQLLLALSLSIPGAISAYELRWDWATIDTSSLKFPKGFLWGVATSEYQNSGAKNCPNNDWAQDDKKFKSGAACDSFNRVDEDIALAQKLGVNSYRLSIEWSLIEPEEGKFDEAVLEHYKVFCDKLIAAGMKVMITFHHFTNPVWFAKKGQFEKKENVHYFVRYCVKVFEALKDKVDLWSTINEPGVYAFQGYVFGDWPPYNHFNFTQAGRVLRNMMRAHVQVYTAIKKISPQAQIGIVHDIVQFEPYHNTKPERNLAYYFNHIFHQAITDFFKTGDFIYEAPTTRVEYHNPLGAQSLDFIGLNYYSHSLLIAPNPIKPYRSDEIPTDMPYSIYPEGLYQAIKEVAQLKVPIYITENGISDGKDDRRELFIKRYIYALSQAIHEGCDVRGYFYWSLLDNFEWHMGYKQKFGLYEVNMKTFERKLRKGSEYYAQVIQAHKS